MKNSPPNERAILRKTPRFPISDEIDFFYFFLYLKWKGFYFKLISSFPELTIPPAFFFIDVHTRTHSRERAYISRAIIARCDCRVRMQPKCHFPPQSDGPRRLGTHAYALPASVQFKLFYNFFFFLESESF